ncbi:MULTISPECIES: acetoin reductase [Streptomyces]|uniref:diacetyl reductase [(S)-acetoin forming] n=2 Tax=Streptomyces TaxID=1883 RepID=A0ABT9KV25_9ACTN|nr:MULTISPECIES: acetoin reductase [Streptomyces]MBW8090405.1 acetoin reductase [Streptomyces hygroscopicus subsp. hygroscopicus]MCO8302738.1 acetoin reductase [Streptomyces sp. RKCA744]MDP9612298.1 meso-butanediol dehydrogenase/(S,S)-butanediol dehydrogenase/diacetyl reductase [Streptomyces demainii]GHJ26446.1 diacetyl reductase [Streptomyces hygroscopicus]GLV75452.1 diacetyl reductase [Streptomyces hygroscopicus subsp. hygroscopicus]
MTSRIAIVTGAARGIGRGIAERLAQDGLDVAVADLPAMRGELDEVVAAIEQRGRRALAVETDVTSKEQTDALVRDVADHFGKLDVFVANAGIARVAPLLDTEVEEFEKVMAVNLRGVFLSYQAAARQMIAQGTGGKIIGAASIVAYRPFALLGPYSASKWGVRGLTQAAAMEWAKHGITVNAYCPGIVGTAMWDLIDEKLAEAEGLAKGRAIKKHAEAIALGRVEEPADVAAFVSYLASPDSDYMTGQSVMIDGGIQFS